MQRMRRYGGFALLALALCALVPAGAAAKTFKPTRLDDPVADGCKKNDCSLREAVIKANARPGPDVIRLKEGTYEIELAFGDAPQADGLDVFSEIDIRGAGTAQTRIDGNGIDRPIEIGAGITAANMDVTLERLTLTGGDAGAATAGNGDSSGGGVVAYRAEALTLRRVLITGNEAQFGGGVRSFGDQTLSIKQSTIAGNNAAEGGGLDLRSNLDAGPSKKAKISASTISGNFAAKGAGIIIDGHPATGEVPSLKMMNSTVAGNMASGDGGGIYADNEAKVNLDNVSIGFNKANDDNAGGGSGGGIVQHSAAVFKVKDSVLASNGFGTGGSDEECLGTFTGKGNAVNAPTGCTSFNGSGNTVPATLIANPLADNGGPTETMSIPESSPAAGFARTCPKRDQRGRLRPHQHCDSGSYEDHPID